MLLFVFLFGWMRRAGEAQENVLQRHLVDTVVVQPEFGLGLLQNVKHLLGRREAIVDDGHKGGERRQQRVGRGRVLGVMKPLKDPSLFQLSPEHFQEVSPREVSCLISGKGAARAWGQLAVAPAGSLACCGTLHVQCPLSGPASLSLKRGVGGAEGPFQFTRPRVL